MAELEHVLKALKNKKAKDAKGIVAEMYKNSGGHLKGLLLHTVNEALDPHATLPSEWRRNRIKVLFKSGNTAQPENYRPIVVIPILYKIFSMLLNRRLEPILDAQQSMDQAGFRKGFTTADHMHTATMLIEKMQE